MFRTMTSCLLVTVAAVAWLPHDTPSFAEDTPDPRATVERMFEAGWDTSYSARETVDREMSTLPPDARSEPRIQYAHALTLIKQGRQREAIEVVDALVKAYRESMTPLKTRIWLSVLTEQYPRAMADMELLSDLLSRQPETPTQRDEYRTTARTMGLLFGYLEGSRGDKVSTTTLASRQKKIQENLDTPLEEAFREGQRDAIVAYLDLKREYEELESEAIEESERVRIEESKRIDAEQERLRERHKRLKEDIARKREELQSELDALSSAEAPLLEQQAIADRNRLVVFRELTEIVDRIVELEHRLIHERDPVIRVRLRRDIQRLADVEDDMRFDILQAERQMASAQGELDGLQRRSAQLQGSMNAELQRADREVRDIDRHQKKLVADAKKLQKPILDTRPLLPLRRKIESLATYAPFPLEEEKRRLLASLRN